MVPLLYFAFISVTLHAQEPIFDTLTVKHGYKFQNNHSLYLAYQFIYPSGNTAPIRRIREQITNDFFSYTDAVTKVLDNHSSPSDRQDDSHRALNLIARQYEDAIIEEIATQLKVEDNGFTGKNYDEKYSAVSTVNNKVFVYMMQGYWYRGGLHGLETTTTTNYDLQTGDKITIDDLFPEESQSVMLELVKQEIDESLWPKVMLTDNFMILPKGIRFRFNPYEIASYGDGRIDATVKYTDFRHLLKPTAIRYFKQ